ncbi:MAG: hypothetical protein GWM98_04710 [Nitrospinaceae bacterium]|nr:hypothetical protein [Nitrospinaceae bacterium]
MPLTELIFGITKAQIGVLQLDASIEERHSIEVDITDSPIEDGSIVSDHIRRRPKVIEINGIVTNTPITFFASLTAPSPLTSDFLPSDDRVEAAYSEIERLADVGEIVDVITTLKKYSNMVVQSANFTRNVQNGNILSCSIVCREMIIANQLVDTGLPIPEEIGNAVSSNLGTTSPSAASPAQAGGGQDIIGLLLGGV